MTTIDELILHKTIRITGVTVKVPEQIFSPWQQDTYISSTGQCRGCHKAIPQDVVNAFAADPELKTYRSTADPQELRLTNILTKDILRDHFRRTSAEEVFEYFREDLSRLKEGSSLVRSVDSTNREYHRSETKGLEGRGCRECKPLPEEVKILLENGAEEPQFEGFIYRLVSDLVGTQMYHSFREMTEEFKPVLEDKSNIAYLERLPDLVGQEVNVHELGVYGSRGSHANQEFIMTAGIKKEENVLRILLATKGQFILPITEIAQIHYEPVEEFS